MDCPLTDIQYVRLNVQSGTLLSLNSITSNPEIFDYVLDKIVKARFKY